MSPTEKIRGLVRVVLTAGEIADVARRTGRNMGSERETREMENVPARLRHMDELGIDIQVLYPTIFIEQIADKPEWEIAICRGYNRWLAEIFKQGQARLRWICVLPLLEMGAALEELQFCHEHGAVGVREMRGGFLERGDAAVDDDLQRGPLRLQPVGPVVAQRRNLAVLLRRQALQPGVARMHDEHAAARCRDRVDEMQETIPIVVVVHAEPALHRHRHVAGRDHRRDAVRDERGFAHQAGAEAAGLHAVGRATAIEVDLVEAAFGADARGLREQCRVAAPELQRDRMFDAIHRQQPRAIAMDHRVGVHHLGIEPGVRRERAMEHAAVRVRPIHHRSYRQHDVPMWLFLLHINSMPMRLNEMCARLSAHAVHTRERFGQ